MDSGIRLVAPWDMVLLAVTVAGLAVGEQLWQGTVRLVLRLLVEGEMVMAMPSGIPVIDVDTHVIEPPDLWTARVSSKYGDLVPHVRWDDEVGDEAWFTGNERLIPVGGLAMAGWHEFPPQHPKRWEDVAEQLWNPARRIDVMDKFGIRAQVLYPNVGLFGAKTILELDSAELALDLVRAYNDWLADWTTVAPGRFVPIATLPFWDVKATLAEIERCVEMGHKGLTFSQDPSYFGLPTLTDPAWDPLWASAEEKGLSINFHIASAGGGLAENMHVSNGMHAIFAQTAVANFISNADTIARVIFGGMAHRFPTLNFISVESGIGWLPFALEAMDWQWKNCGVTQEHPEYDLLPSEYFRRQVYGCFWFEEESARAAIAQVGAANIMYETDFPHPTSMHPGPNSVAVRPDDYLRETFSELPESDLRLILHDNAARVYGLD